MKYIFIIMIGTMLAVWMFLAAQQFRSAKKECGLQKLITLFAASFITIGALGFFGAALAASGGLNWLPSSFEWPIGMAKGVVSTKDSFFVVPHTSSGRIQVYDRNWKFLRGWHLDAGGGTFKLHVTDTNHIHVVTARGHMHQVYDLNGKLLSSESYPATGSGYSSFPSEGVPHTVPTPLYLWVFTSPFYSWLMAAAGIGLFLLRTK